MKAIHCFIHARLVYYLLLEANYCQCSGSIKYIHESCLMEWMKHSNKGKYCEICKHEFKFEKVYAHDTPKDLSPLLLVRGILTFLFNYIKSISRILFVIFVWMVVVPFISSQLYRIVNISSWSLAELLDWNNFVYDFSILTFIRDCSFGATICIVVLLLDLFTAGILEFVKTNLELLENYVNPQNQANTNTVTQDGDEIVTLRDLLEQQAILDEEEQEPGTQDTIEDVQDIIEGGEAPQQAEEPIPPVAEDAQQENVNIPGPVVIVDRQIPDVPQIDVNGAPREEIDLEQMIGLKGSIVHLFETVALVLFLNSQHIFFLLFLPLQVGKLICNNVVNELGISSVITEILIDHKLITNTTETMPLSVLNQTIESIGNSTQLLTETIEAPVLLIGEKVLYIVIGYIFLIGAIFALVLLNYFLHHVVSKHIPITFVSQKLLYYTKYIVLLVKIGFILFANFVVVPYLVGNLLVYSTEEFFRSYSLGGSNTKMTAFNSTNLNQTMYPLQDWFNFNYTIPSLSLFNSTGNDTSTAKVISPFVRTLITGLYHESKSWSSEEIIPKILFFASTSFIYFMLGIIFVVIASSWVQTLRSFLSKRVLWFLRDPDDPEFHYLKELVTLNIKVHLRRILFSFVFLSILLLALVRTPLKLARFLLQDYDFFPVSLASPLGESSTIIELTIDASLPILLLNHQQQRWFNMQRLKQALKVWFEVGGSFFQLKSYLFDSDDGNTAAARDTARQVEYPSYFSLRLSAFFLVTWCALIEIIAIGIIAPLILGKVVLSNLLSFTLGIEIKNHFYIYIFGVYLLNGIIFVIGYIYTERSLRQIIKWAAIIFKCLVLLFLWFIIVPTLIGGAIQMCIAVPTKLLFALFMTDNFDDSLTGQQPVLLIAEVWSIGLFFSISLLKVCRYIPGMEHFKTELDRMKNNGFRNVELLRVINQMILPVVYRLIIYLTIPFILNKLILPFFVTPLIQYRIFILSYPSMLILIGFRYALRSLLKIYRSVHDSVKDHLFLSRETLVNHGSGTTAIQANN